MTRPALRPMRALPVLEPRRDALEKCVFCPKLCRSACPVSNAEPRETITPWGKMSAAWWPPTGTCRSSSSHAAPAWACTGCFACREACDHRNVVADVLLDARDALAQRGVAPDGARRSRRALRSATTRGRATAAVALGGASGRAPPKRATRSSSGCGYLRAAKREARDAVDAATALAGATGRARRGCCGLPLLLAGDARASRSRRGRSRGRLAEPRPRVGRRRRLRAHAPASLRRRPGCTLARSRWSSSSRRRRGALDELAPIARRDEDDERDEHQPVRWHDPCQLGRGLGVYEAPRRAHARAGPGAGRAPRSTRARPVLGRGRAPAVDDARASRAPSPTRACRRTRAPAAGAS